MKSTVLKLEISTLALCPLDRQHLEDQGYAKIVLRQGKLLGICFWGVGLRSDLHTPHIPYCTKQNNTNSCVLLGHRVMELFFVHRRDP